MVLWEWACQGTRHTDWQHRQFLVLGAWCLLTKYIQRNSKTMWHHQQVIQLPTCTAIQLNSLQQPWELTQQPTVKLHFELVPSNSQIISFFLYIHFIFLPMPVSPNFARDIQLILPKKVLKICWCRNHKSYALFVGFISIRITYVYKWTGPSVSFSFCILTYVNSYNFIYFKAIFSLGLNFMWSEDS